MTQDLAADASLADFLSRCAHDLRASLTAIQGYTGLLGSGQAGSLTGRQREFLAASVEQQEQLHRQLDVFFTLSGYLTGARIVRRERIDLSNELARYCEERKRSGCSVAVSLHPGTVPTSVQAIADAALLDQILDMLLPVVAATAAACGDPSAEILLGCLQNSERAWVTLGTASRTQHPDSQDMAVLVAMRLLPMLGGILEWGHLLPQDAVRGAGSLCRIGLPLALDAGSHGMQHGGARGR